MAKEADLKLATRTALGTRACRRLRRDGQVPGNVYGHDAEPVAVSTNAAEFRAMVMSGVRVFNIDVEGRTDKALLKELNWDAFGDEVDHFDMMRVDPNERVTVHVPIELKGIAPGAMGGAGMLEQPIHELTIDCLAYQIPTSIPVRINTLEIGQAIHVKELEVPEGIHVHAQPDAVVVHVVQVRSAPEPEAGGITGAQPEVVGKKTEEAAK